MDGYVGVVLYSTIYAYLHDFANTLIDIAVESPNTVGARLAHVSRNTVRRPGVSS